MAAWGAWYEDLGDALVDPGNPFGPVVKNIVPGGAVGNGPIGTQASGYTILAADSQDSAVAMAKKCPMLDGNGQITVYEALDMQ